VSVAHWAETLAFVDERRQAVLDRDRTGRDGVDLLEIELVRACLTAALGDRARRDEALTSAGAAATAAAIGWVRDDGQIELPASGGARLFPARGVSIAPSTWLAAVGVCRLLRDEAGLAALGHPPLLELLGETADDFWVPVGRALTTPTAETIATARAALAEHGGTVAEPEFVSLRVRPLLEVLRAGEQTAFDAALAAALRCHEEFYLYDEWEYDSLGLLPLPVLGIAAHGHDRGFHIGTGADRMPPDLIRGGLRALGPVRYHFPPARLHRSEEARWFLDLEGFPREGRGEDREEGAGDRTATYTARNGPGLPEARMDVTDAADGDLLDVGELVLAADLLAGRAGDDRQRRAWLTEAADCLAAARTRSEPRFVHERGWAAYRAEPTRFDPERLAAVESAWREMADSAADVSTTVLRLRLEPMLQAIAFDRTGVALRELRPRDDDYAKTFAATVVDRARKHYEELWAGPLDFRHPEAGAHVEVHVAALGDDHELFPGRHGEVAAVLLPGRVWASWRYVAPGRTAGLFYHGLAWCDDHWAWFPKPYRLLSG